MNIRKKCTEMLKIIPLVLNTEFAEGTVNAYLVIEDSITLIDTGNPGKEAFNQLKEKLKNNRVMLSDIDRIILTHSHVDHAGGISYIQKETDIPIYVHENAKPFLTDGLAEYEKGEAFFYDFFKESGADINQHRTKRLYRPLGWRNVHYLKDGENIDIAGKLFHVVHVPGHSQQDIVLWREKTGEAFIGDHLINDFSVNAFIEPPLPGDKVRPHPLLQYRSSLNKVRKLPLNMCYPGHGKLFYNHQELIDRRIAEQEKRCDHIMGILAEKERTIYEISQLMYPRLKKRAVYLGLSQVQGHMDLLVERKYVSVIESEGVLYYLSIR